MAACLLAMAIFNGANCQRQRRCFFSTTTVEKYSSRLSGRQAYKEVNEADYGFNQDYGYYGRRRRDVADKPSYKPSYKAPNTVIDAGKVLVMPPPGVAPKDVPQFGQPGGGAPPQMDPYTAAMAPEDTVPVAVFPPFSEYKKHPTKCVVFSELTDFETNDTMPSEPFGVSIIVEGATQITGNKNRMQLKKSKFKKILCP